MRLPGPTRWITLGVGMMLAGSIAGQVLIEPRRTNLRSEPAPQSNIRIDSSLVLVPVTVWDPMNRPVTGLERDHFRLFDDRVEQTVTHFAMDDEPLAVGLVFDSSGSMGNKLKRSRMAAAAFFKTANPEDEFFLVEFGDRPKVVVPLTGDPQQIQARLTQTRAKGRTALLDAIYLSMYEMKKSQRRRKALLVISDGGDNSSRYTEVEVRNLVRERDVTVYAIGIFEPMPLRVRTAEEMSGPGLLSEIAEETGGRHFPVENLNELPDIAGKIGVELRNRYLLGFAPSNPARDGKYHRLQVRIAPPRGLPPLHLSWRMGYYAPNE